MVPHVQQLPSTYYTTAKCPYPYSLWETGSTASSITLPQVKTSRTVSVIHTNQGGRRQETVFRINVQAARPDIIVNGGRYTDKNMMIVEKGDNVTLTATPADAMKGGAYLWGDGSTKDSLTINNVQTSASYTLDYTINGQTSTITYQIYVKETGYRSARPTERILPIMATTTIPRSSLKMSPIKLHNNGTSSTLLLLRPTVSSRFWTEPT